MGIGDGQLQGFNTRAALMTRGLAEITRLGVRMGAEPTTFLGLSGMGDLLLTCTGSLSRNRRVGLALGEGSPCSRDVRSEPAPRLGTDHTTRFNPTSGLKRPYGLGST